MKPYDLKYPYLALADFLTADFGLDLRVFPDGTHDLVSSNTYDPDDPGIRLRCPGIGQLDTSRFTTDFVGQNEQGAYVEKGTGRVVGGLEAVIRVCVRDGDVEDLLTAVLLDLDECRQEKGK